MVIIDRPTGRNYQPLQQNHVGRLCPNAQGLSLPLIPILGNIGPRLRQFLVDVGLSKWQIVGNGYLYEGGAVMGETTQECRGCLFLSFHHHNTGLFGKCDKDGWKTKSGGMEYRAETIAKNLSKFIASRGRNCDVYRPLAHELLGERVELIANNWDPEYYGDVGAYLNVAKVSA